MKRFPQIDRFFTAVCSFAILALFVLLSSCEKDSLQDDSLRIKASNVSTASFVSKVYDNSIDCEDVCIIEGIEEYYVKSDYVSVQHGNHTKSVEYIAYNTSDEFKVEVYFFATNANAAVDISINIDGIVKPFTGVKSGETGVMLSHTIPLEEGSWKACDDIEFKIHQGGFGDDIDFNEIYSLIGVCSSSCEESFSYEENQDGSYTFTYVSSEDLENAEVKFTCPHISNVDGFKAIDDKEYEVNPGNSNGSPTVLTWTGDIQACTETTFILKFDADCDQNNAGKANLFTDFKVNGESKKGDNENIVFQCN